MVGTRSTAREPLEEPSSITESPRPIVTSGGTQDETLHDTAAALPPGGTSAPVAPVTTASNGSHATTTAGVPQPNDTSQPLRDLTAALLEVVRGVRPAPATHRCLGKRTWNHRCKGKKCEAQGCEYYHHKLLHDDAAQPMKSDNGVAAPRQRTQSNRAGGQATVFESCSNATTAAAGALRSVQTYLKVLPVQLSGPHGEIDTYALLDDGSTITLLTSSLADKIGVAGPAAPFVIEAIAGAHIDAVNSQRVKFSIKGKYTNNKINIEARTIDSLNISPQSVPTEALAHCEHLQDISDQLVYATAEPLILIGQDNWSLLIASEVRRGKLEQPVASHTPLGWVLHGQKRVCPYGRGGYMLQERFHCSHAHTKDEALEQLIKEHYDLESLGVEPRRPQADPEIRALQILQKTTKALTEGGYETGLLWKEEGKPFPNNYQAVLGRLQGVEKRLKKNPALSQKYKEQMHSLFENKYAELAPTAPPVGNTWYLPHFPVVNPSKPGKVRIVKDAAARTDGVCLNDYLLTGPDLLQSLLGVLMRFRQKPVAVAADIKDMFLRIKIRVSDRDALRFLWRDETDHAPMEYRMTSLLFGATSSPSTAIYVKNHNALLHQEEFPEAVDPIINNHYMDDYLQSFDTAAEANRVAQAVDAVHRRGNFVLQKWASNDSNAIAGLAVEPMTPNVNINEEEKILGLVWRIADDTLGFNLSKFSFNNSITKRQLLKEVMSLYDPLGLVTPITIQGKQILQEAWRSNVGWDDPLPFKLEQVWQTWLISLQGLKDVALPRCYPLFSSAETLELHVFVDASEVAYAAAAYWRSVNDKGEVQVSLAAAKARVAPIKIVSIPRLELQAAVLGGRLAHAVELHHSRRPDRRVLWTDSRTVLSWLRAGSRSFKPFVAHRVAELEETTTTSEWRWVPTADNVADDATRRVQTDFTAAHRWFRGPEFLYKEEKLWPHDKDPLHSTETGEERVAATTIRPQLKDALPDVSRFSSWIHLIRSTARILQFIDRCKTHTVTAMRRKRTRCTPSEDPDWTGVQPRSSRAIARTTPQRNHSNASASRTYVPLAAFYTRRAELIWTRALQEDCFSSELRDITGGRRLSTDSRLRHLSLTTDQNGVMRLRSRTAAATDINEETLSPAVLDGDHAYSRLYINWIHRKLHHSGVECVTNEIRQRFWMLRIRPTVRAVIRRCQPCRLRRATPPEPLTGNLPPCRLTHHQRPFTQTGLDYFGPLSVTIARHHEKRYVALFTCLTTRAVHLEIASSLSADAAVLALRRMMARRGCPDTVWSDNGSNFHGADAELRKAALTSMKQEADIRQINWHYIPPGAPFMGGAWERLVRSVKTALTATLHERHPHEDVLHTLLTEVEHTINSRPLSHVSVAPEDDTALTPNHFLLGGPSKVPLPGAFTKVDELGRSHWKAAQRLADLFWQRWVREVLPLLHHRREPHGHGEAVKVGDVVVIVDSTLPRNVWPKGRVEQVYPGADGVIRVVDVKTKNGLMRRPTKRLVILPVEC
ncbi:uncharacterized protein LOC128680823 [Plodia interpunctella]|uniref:uncharacterized protein LOC128680823 n=1 Tax=Plodia interpunctella TaxID=58824 RepID=UPI0023679E4E|nr:uncharacterized protein LOC128680823 [Plodia interpunctella]